MATAATLISVADVLLPDVHRCLSAVAPFFESRREAGHCAKHTRGSAPQFLRTALQAGVPLLAVSTPPALTWSDLGTTERLFRLIRTLRLAPPWMRGRGGVLTGRTRRAE